jgi:hypothetical protein
MQGHQLRQHLTHAAQQWGRGDARPRRCTGGLGSPGAHPKNADRPIEARSRSRLIVSHTDASSVAGVPPPRALLSGLGGDLIRRASRQEGERCDAQSGGQTPHRRGFSEAGVSRSSR